jgi:hypothetical protein
MDFRIPQTDLPQLSYLLDTVTNKQGLMARACSKCEGESVNRWQMDIKRKTCNIWTWENIYFSTYPPPTLIHLSRFTCASKSAALKCLDYCLSHFRTSVSTSSSSAKRLPPSCEPLYATNTSHSKQNTFLYEYPFHWVLLPIKTHNITLFFFRTLLKNGRRFDYWSQPLNMRMRVCYIDSHEAGLCCYLVTHIENLLHPLQLFYLHSWPIYWLSFVLWCGWSVQ